MGEEFGWVECTNQQGSSGRYPQARLSALTDVLNRIGRFIRSSCPGSRANGLWLWPTSPLLKPEDLALLDRGYAGYQSCLPGPAGPAALCLSLSPVQLWSGEPAF